ncbi:MAG: Kazal-type serine protease inhibitor family protein [Myxococcota bacterium]
MRSAMMVWGALLALGCGDGGRAAPDAGGAVDLGRDGPRTDSGARDLGIDAGDAGDDAGADLGDPDLGGLDLGGMDLGRVDLGGPDLGSDAAVDMAGGDAGMDMAPGDLGADASADMALGDLGADAGTDMTPGDLGADLGADLGPGGCSATVACPATDYCDFPASDPCGAAGAIGRCTMRPMFCTRILDPHCGCDGRTYGNQCEAFAGGTDTLMRGACP